MLYPVVVFYSVNLQDSGRQTRAVRTFSTPYMHGMGTIPLIVLDSPLLSPNSRLVRLPQQGFLPIVH
jgi:hypothetical protein